MKRFIALAMSFSALGAFALDALPNGHWAGQGHGSLANGQAVEYGEDLTVKDNTLTSVLTIGEQKFTYVMKHVFKTGGFTDVTIEQRAGENRTLHSTGYCGSAWCHVASDDGNFEMTYVFEHGEVYELGSDVEQGQRGWFESALKPVNK